MVSVILGKGSFQCCFFYVNFLYFFTGRNKHENNKVDIYNKNGRWLGDGDDSKAMAVVKDEWVYVTLVVDTTQSFEYGTKNEKGYVNGPLTKTYVNGELFGTGCVAPNMMSSTNKFFLGINLWDTPMRAYYDDVALWKRSLSESEVKMLYQAETNGVELQAVNTEDNKSSGISTNDSDNSGSGNSETTSTAVSSTKLKTLNLSSVKAKKGKKKITGKVSVSKAVVMIKVGKKKYKKATVKGKKFTLKTSKLKKKTKIIIKVTKKGYKTLKKTCKIK